GVYRDRAVGGKLCRRHGDPRPRCRADAALELDDRGGDRHGRVPLRLAVDPGGDRPASLVYRLTASKPARAASSTGPGTVTSSGTAYPSGAGMSPGTGIVTSSAGAGDASGSGCSIASPASPGSPSVSGSPSAPGATGPTRAARSSVDPAKTLRSTSPEKPGTSPSSARCQNSHSVQPPIIGRLGSETSYSASHSG